jgi:hypothetical protein
VQLEQQCRMHCSQNGKMNRLPIESVIWLNTKQYKPFTTGITTKSQQTIHFDEIWIFGHLHPPIYPKDG